MAENVICLVQSEAQAVEITEKLKNENFTENEIIVLSADKTGMKEFEHQNNPKTANGATAGTLVKLGVSESEAKRYEDKIIGGKVLILVQAKDSDTRNRIEQIYKNYGASEIDSIDTEATKREPGTVTHNEAVLAKQKQTESEKEKVLNPDNAQINKDSTTSTTDPNDPEIPGKEEPPV